MVAKQKETNLFQRDKSMVKVLLKSQIEWKAACWRSFRIHSAGIRCVQGLCGPQPKRNGT